MRRYCRKCVMPNTKPDLSFDAEGVCDACRSAGQKRQTDWAAREIEFRKLVEWARAVARGRGNSYDCVVPVSGGKDSTFQTLRAIEYGLRPLCVSFEPTWPTELGQRNLANLSRYADVVQFRKDREVYRRLQQVAFRAVGDNEWPNHVGIFTVPVQEAVRRNIPLLIWGENPQNEYGGPNEASRAGRILDRRWLEEFGGLLGLRTADFVEEHGFDARDLAPYAYPSLETLEGVGIQGVFLGYYFLWDACAQVDVVTSKGFCVSSSRIPGTYRCYENLDCRLTVVHDHLKWLKYGFGRATDHACLDIRNGRLTRAEGIEMVRSYDGELPKEDFETFCEWIQMAPTQVIEVFDSFTNWTLHQRVGWAGRPRLQHPIWEADA